MTSFRVDIPADPRWLHVPRTVVVTAAGRFENASELADLSLVLDEATLAVAAATGVTGISVSGITDEGSIAVDVVGTGREIDHEEEGIDLLTVALDTLAPGHTVVRSSHEYRISLRFGDRHSRP
jgi:hypothetical protein